MAKNKNEEIPEEPIAQYTCPFCFSKVDLRHTHYTCTGPSCAKEFAMRASSTRNAENLKYVSKDGQNEVDYEKSLVYGRDPASDNAIIAKNHIVRDSSGFCDICKRPVYIRVCPICHNPIPPGVEEEGNQIYVILGPKGVGKSHYIAVLVNQLKNYVATEFKSVLNAATDGTTMKYRERYYRRLYEEMRKLPPTSSFVTADENREPLIYYFRMFDSKPPKVFTFAFFDTAGEDLTSSDKMRSLGIDNYLANAAGVVFLVDPLQIRYINQRIHVDNKPAVGPDVNDMLNNICQIIRSNRNISAKAKIDIPIAIVLTKSDVLFKAAEDEEEDKVLIAPCSALHVPREPGKYDKENFDQIDVELEEYLRRCLGDGFIQTVNGFEDHCYFAVSALGCNPTGTVLPRGVSPMRVEDPFIWLFKGGLQ